LESRSPLPDTYGIRRAGKGKTSGRLGGGVDVERVDVAIWKQAVEVEAKPRDSRSPHSPEIDGVDDDVGTAAPVGRGRDGRVLE
jgi:hypothetical protein